MGLNSGFIRRNFVRVYKYKLFQDKKLTTNVTDKHT
jgi:hypothetical protein